MWSHCDCDLQCKLNETSENPQSHTIQVCNTLIVDIHPDRPATASAAVSLVRCSVAAVGVSILQLLLDHLGPGWTFSLLGALGVMTAPMLWIVWLWGMGWRTERKGKLGGPASEPGADDTEKREQMGQNESANG